MSYESWCCLVAFVRQHATIFQAGAVWSLGLGLENDACEVEAFSSSCRSILCLTSLGVAWSPSSGNAQPSSKQVRSGVWGLASRTMHMRSKLEAFGASCRSIMCLTSLRVAWSPSSGNAQPSSKLVRSGVWGLASRTIHIRSKLSALVVEAYYVLR